MWFQNRRAKFRKQERIAQQKVTNHSNSSSEHPSSNNNNNNNVKLEMKNQGGNTTPIKDIIKPSSPISTVSTTPNSNASSHPSESHNNMKSINGTYLPSGCSCWTGNDLSSAVTGSIGQFIKPTKWSNNNGTWEKNGDLLKITRRGVNHRLHCVSSCTYFLRLL